MMERTQIYLTQDQRQALELIATRRGQSKSEVIREAITLYIADTEATDRRELMRQAAGIWADRDDLPEFFEELRRELDSDIMDESVEPISVG
jgi:metal-responsive CopG/Arc/MetJ family transcriptional regulator